MLKLRDYLDILEEYDWEENQESLESVLYWDDELNKDDLDEDWSGMPFDVGDIVMLRKGLGGISEHRIYVITSLINPEEGPEYDGYILSSRVNKANINNPKYPNNIYIKNYGSILKKGGDWNNPNLDAIIKIDQRFTLTNDEVTNKNAKKGICSDLFNKFINTVVYKYEHGMDTSKDYWDNGKPVVH